MTRTPRRYCTKKEADQKSPPLHFPLPTVKLNSKFRILNFEFYLTLCIHLRMGPVTVSSAVLGENTDDM